MISSIIGFLDFQKAFKRFPKQKFKKQSSRGTSRRVPERINRWLKCKKQGVGIYAKFFAVHNTGLA